MSEINPFRLQLASRSGNRRRGSARDDLVAQVNEHGRRGRGRSLRSLGIAAGADLMTKLPRTRGRIVVVAIFAEASPGGSVPVLLARVEAVRRAGL